MWYISYIQSYSQSPLDYLSNIAQKCSQSLYLSNIAQIQKCSQSLFKYWSKVFTSTLPFKYSTKVLNKIYIDPVKSKSQEA